jgi:hypothetical protein
MEVYRPCGFPLRDSLWAAMFISGMNSRIIPQDKRIESQHPLYGTFTVFISGKSVFLANAQGIEAVSFLPQAKKYKRKARFPARSAGNAPKKISMRVS